jgi:hypothetical protein
MNVINQATHDAVNKEIERLRSSRSQAPSKRGNVAAWLEWKREQQAEPVPAPKCCHLSPQRCFAKARFEREGKWYCGVHDPVSIERRREAKVLGQRRIANLSQPTALEQLHSARDQFLFAELKCFEKDGILCDEIRATAYKLWLCAVQRFRAEGRTPEECNRSEAA